MSLRPDALGFAQPSSLQIWSIPIRSIRICRVLAVAFGLVVPVAGAGAQAPAVARYAIGAQPLADALDAYGAASGRDIYYDGTVVVGRHSSAIEGLFAPDDALRGLLAGSGLVARTIGPNTVSVAPSPAPRAAASAIQQSYFAAVQARVTQVLCARPDTRPGASDVLIQLWIGPAGTVQRARLLDVADGRDLSAFTEALQGVAVAGGVPAGLPQPVTIAVLARSEGDAAGCTGATRTATGPAR